MSKALRVHNLSAGYGGDPIIRNISFELHPGEILHVVGPNGAGKSTLLRTIARMIRDNTGQISFGGVDLSNRYTHELRSLGISWFVQGGMVLPSLTVSEHFELVLDRYDRNARVQIKEECLSQFPSLKDLLPTRGGNLSGGQRQSLSLAMLVAQQTDCWLMDEPMAGLDAEATTLLDEHVQFALRNGKAILLIEHSSLNSLNQENTLKL